MSKESDSTAKSIDLALVRKNIVFGRSVAKSISPRLPNENMDCLSEAIVIRYFWRPWSLRHDKSTMAETRIEFPS
jgi:phosphopantetheinyl transferase